MKIQVQSIEMLAKDGKLATVAPERLARMMSTANAQITRLTKLVDDLLDVTRISSGRISLEIEQFDLSGLVHDIFYRFATDLKRAECEISLFLEPDLVGFFDQFRIEQVVTNLITNVIRYSPGKPVEVYTRRLESESAQIEVKDYGMGIPLEDQKRIFERFERAVPSANFGGLGLGLFIVRQIVEMHGGTIQVKSKPGEGASFIVTLPLHHNKKLLDSQEPKL